MIALNLQFIGSVSPAGSARILQSDQQRGEIVGFIRQPANDGHDLALFPSFH